MPLTIDATVGGASANAYTDVDAADEWLTFRVGAGAWATLEDDAKAQALVTATRDIDALHGAERQFIGERATDTQALEWPRSGAEGYESDMLPARLVYATIEYAFTLATTPAGAADPLNVDPEPVLKRKKTGPIEREWFAPSEAPTALALENLPPMVQRWLSPLFRPVALAAWGQATAYRSS